VKAILWLKFDIIELRMKKLILIVFIGFGAISACYAQNADSNRYEYVRPPSNQNFDNLNNAISLGLGIGGYYPYKGLYYAESPNISLFYERSVLKHLVPGNITLGILASFKQINSSYEGYYTGYNYQQNWSYYTLGVRTTYRIINFPLNNIDSYAGGMAAYYITAFKFTSTDPDYNEPNDPGYYLTPNNYPNFFAFSVFAGVQSKFSNRGYIWGEVGYGYTTLAFGIRYML
jgi:hypothetical protein